MFLKVFFYFKTASRALSGRKFEDRMVVVDFYDENKFVRGELV